MASFEVVFSRVRREWRRRPEDIWVIEVNLAARLLFNGKPERMFVGRIGRIAEDALGDAAELERFWSAAKARLGRMRRLTRDDVKEIERQVAERVPRPAPGAQVMRNREVV